MDQAAIKAGGEPSFFIGDLEPFAWSKLVDSRMGNQEKMNLYGEALVKFSEAKQLPELFRIIFRSAFLPYRSPETLGLFLKEISYFDYSHPEELGNAYEYLLSIMSSQGDAGQFRTPRHIIDFIVDVLNPTKDDKVLDPACGTGGFLVSTYNHILEQHDGKNDPKKKEKTLTPDERKKLMQNLQGYDIDPTMVRIAQVNMYLHQFKNPQIFQYDSLTSDERWSEKFDVILANPPFMTPKGGIKPHNKFGVTSNRSEVLFVDYILSHLKPKGRAGIIVPEGIITQSGNAYKDLRKFLVENGLYAVVSLPGGVFQPYSGVKTSILLVDKEFEKRDSEVLFIKILADGFDLGSSKRVVQENDLPKALEILKSWQSNIRVENKIASWISRETLAKSGDYSFSVERHRTSTDYSKVTWEMLPLEEICQIESGSRDKGGALSQGVFSIGGEQIEASGKILFNKMKYISPEHFANMRKGVLVRNDVLIVKDGATTGKIGYWDFDYPAAVNEHVFILRPENRILPKFLMHLVQSSQFQSELGRYIKGLIGGISLEIKKIELPVPPLEIQEQCVAELEGYSSIISGAQQVVDNWKPSIDNSANHELVELNELCKVQNGYAFSSTDMGEFQEGYLPVIKIGNVGADGLIDTKCKFHSYSKKLENFLLKDGDVVIAMTGATVGKVATIPNGKFLLNQRVGKILVVNPVATLDYIRLALQSTKFYSYCQVTATGAAQGNISADEILKFQIPLPPMEVQLNLASLAKEEKRQIESLRTLINNYEERIQMVISKMWSN
jgi:type I restriction enzyme M protein